MHQSDDIYDNNKEGCRLATALNVFTAQAFAAVDGAQFEDLPAVFRAKGLFARSLFLEGVEYEVQAAGPWLLSLKQSPKAISSLIGLLSAKPAAVFWLWEKEEKALYRHLRALNLVRIPSWAANGMDSPAEGVSENDTEVVMFRHWDPSALTPS